MQRLKSLDPAGSAELLGDIVERRGSVGPMVSALCPQAHTRAAQIAYAVRVVADSRRHGWSDQLIADTVGPVSLNLLTGSFNLVAGLEPAPAEQSTKEKHDHVG